MQDLIEAFVRGYPDLVRSRAAALGVSVDIEPAIAEGATWLHTALTELLSRPFAEQARGPLELVQEAVRFPTEALATAGHPRPRRDDVAVAALPGDVYGLAPVSSQDLGEEAWRAHLAWGAAKARQMAPSRPRVGYAGTNLLDRSKLEAVARASGFDLQVVRAATEGAPPPSTVFVDLSAPDADDLIRSLAAAGCRVVAFGPHVDDIAMVRARALGAAEAVPRSRLFRDPEIFLPTIT